MITNQKAVSRERLIGISFVDILIQAVFILFLALTVGYNDPVIMLNIKEYAEAGKDLCSKMNKGSVKECKEVLETMIEKEKGKSALALCLKPISDNKSTLSARWTVISPTEIKFFGFTPQFYEYLEKNGDTERLNQAKSISPGIYSIDSIIPKFGFIREKNCFHSIPIKNVEGRWDQKELDQIFKRLYELQNISK
jgi:hypothetical protein